MSDLTEAQAEGKLRNQIVFIRWVSWDEMAITVNGEEFTLGVTWKGEENNDDS